MIIPCQNIGAGTKIVAWATYAGTGVQAVSGGCKAACCSLLGHGIIFPLALAGIVGYLGYRVRSIATDCPAGRVEAVRPEQTCGI